MIYDEFNDFCSQLIESTHVVQWGGSHVWKVGGKVFAIGGWEKFDQPAFTFKTSEGDFYFLTDEPGLRPAPYMAIRGMKWVQLYDTSEIPNEALKSHIEESYRLVSLGLTKKLQKQLGLNQTD